MIDRDEDFQLKVNHMDLILPATPKFGALWLGSLKAA